MGHRINHLGDVGGLADDVCASGEGEERVRVVILVLLDVHEYGGRGLQEIQVLSGLAFGGRGLVNYTQVAVGGGASTSAGFLANIAVVHLERVSVVSLVVFVQ